MTSFVVQMKDPRWIEAPGSPDWEAMIARLLPPIREGIAACGREAPSRSMAGEVCLVFTNDDEVSALNRAWRGKDGPTNVLSFPAEDDFPEAPQTGDIPEEIVLGDVVLAFETIAREAGEQGKSFHNHTAHLLVHGVLHLLGYDHQSDEEAGQMEGLERRIMAALDIDDPYAEEPQVQEKQPAAD